MSEEARQHPAPSTEESVGELSFRCRICKVVQGDFWYDAYRDCCAECVGIEPPSELNAPTGRNPEGERR